MARRFESGHFVNRTVTDRVFRPPHRHGSHGHLPVPPGAGTHAVRCACDACGAHLYAIVQPGGLSGICVVCGGSRVTPVG